MTNAETNAAVHETGLLHGLRIVEFAAPGPVNYACMLLADMGADVVTIERPPLRSADPKDIVQRGRTRVEADLKDTAHSEAVAKLVKCCDVLVEGFRPGVMERLRLGPERFTAAHPRLIYARATGWGQQGPLARRAGHDINYIALGGALHAIGGQAGSPVFPLNLLGDYAAGSMFLVMGILAALHERSRSGLGQTVDSAIVDGVVSLMTPYLSMLHRGRTTEQRGLNLLDGGAPHYNVYQTSDAKYVVIGSLEPPFLRRLCELLNLPEDWANRLADPRHWPELRNQLAALFLCKPQTAWCELLGEEDVCFAPVLPLPEALEHPHLVARSAAVRAFGTIHTAPAPRFSRSRPAIRSSRTADLEAAISGWTR